MDLTCFQHKRILVTGHTGFKGAWLSIWLTQLGAEVTGLALDPLSADGIFEISGIGNMIRDYRTDIRDRDAVQKVFDDIRPEIVFHLAAQPLVLESYRNPVDTFATNVQGTVHVLEAIRHTPSVQAALMVTSDKCYENREWVHGYRESDPPGGHDPYSASKGAAEIVIASYRRSFFSGPVSKGIASARAGNVIGGGDWSDNRLIPDLFRCIRKDKVLEIRYPDAIRPWQFVLEPLGGYLMLVGALLRDPEKFSGAWNFGPLTDHVVPVQAMVEGFHQHLGKGNWQDVREREKGHEAGLLMLDINKAIYRLGWKPVLDIKETIAFTADWYNKVRPDNALELSQDQIRQYTALWRSRNEK